MKLLSSFLSLQFMVIAACLMGSTTASPAPNHRTPKGGGHQMGALRTDDDHGGLHAADYGIADVCKKADEVVTVLKAHPLVESVCRRHLGIRTVYVKKTISRSQTATKIAGTGGSTMVEVVVTETPEVVFETVSETITGNPVTNTITSTAETIVTSTITTTTIREGQQPAPTDAVGLLRRARKHFARGSFNPELQERAALKNRGSFNPELQERGDDDQVTKDVLHHLIRKFGRIRVAQGCKCLNIPVPTQTVLVTRTWTRYSTTTLSSSSATAMTTTTLPVTTSTITSTSTFIPTATLTTITTTTSVIPATATATLPTQCFEENKVVGQAIFLRTGDILNQGPIPHEECCYRCWNTPNCIFFRYTGGDCSIITGSQLLDYYVDVGPMCPNGINPDSGIVSYGGLDEEFPGPCIGQRREA